MKASLPFAGLLLCGFALTGCDAWSSQPDPLPTVIEEVRVEPNPVVAGGTTTFTAVTPDTAKTGFSYYWSVPGGAETVAPRYVWSAQVPPGEYVFSVQISREGFSLTVKRSFEVIVIPNQ